MDARFLFFCHSSLPSYFKLNLSEWHWFSKPYRFQVYNSTKNHLRAASWAHCPGQSLFPWSPFPPLPTSTYSATPFPSGHHHSCLVCVPYIYSLNPFTFFPPASNTPPLWQLTVCSM